MRHKDNIMLFSGVSSRADCSGLPRLGNRARRAYGTTTMLEVADDPVDVVAVTTVVPGATPVIWHPPSSTAVTTNALSPLVHDDNVGVGVPPAMETIIVDVAPTFSETEMGLRLTITGEYSSQPPAAGHVPSVGPPQAVSVTIAPPKRHHLRLMRKIGRRPKWDITITQTLSGIRWPRWWIMW